MGSCTSRGTQVHPPVRGESRLKVKRGVLGLVFSRITAADGAGRSKDAALNGFLLILLVIYLIVPRLPRCCQLSIRLLGNASHRGERMSTQPFTS